MTVRLMSDGELRRLEVLRDVDRGGLPVRAATQLLGRSEHQGSVSFPLLRLADGVRFDRLLPTAQGGAVAVANAQIKRDRYLTQQVSRDEQAVIA